jgi:hypothetical protein
MTHTPAKHRGLLFASEGLVLLEGFFVHGLFSVFFAATLLQQRWTVLQHRWTVLQQRWTAAQFFQCYSP